MPTLAEIGNAVGQALSDFGSYTAQAAAQANAVSRQAQSAQAAFNSNAMNTANSITDNRIASQYGYNTAMMASANQYNTQAWENAAAWNEMMWQKQADFNKEEAEKQRYWQEQMANTQYQRAMADMEKAGLNPILASGGISGGIPNGATASVGGAQMSSAQSQMASGGLVGADSASISNYTGQMETLSGILGLLAAMAAGQNSAASAAQTLGEGVAEVIDEVVPDKSSEELIKEVDNLSEKGSIMDWIKFVFNNRPGSLMQDILSDALNINTGSGGRGSTKKK